MLADARQKPVLLERIILLTDDIKDLNNRIAEKDRQISDYKAKDSNFVFIAATYEKEKSIMGEQRKILEQALRKEKRKRFWTSVAGGVGIGIMGYLYFTK